MWWLKTCSVLIVYRSVSLSYSSFSLPSLLLFLSTFISERLPGQFFVIHQFLTIHWSSNAANQRMVAPNPVSGMSASRGHVLHDPTSMAKAATRLWRHRWSKWVGLVGLTRSWFLAEGTSKIEQLIKEGRRKKWSNWRQALIKRGRGEGRGRWWKRGWEQRRMKEQAPKRATRECDEAKMFNQLLEQLPGTSINRKIVWIDKMKFLRKSQYDLTKWDFSSFSAGNVSFVFEERWFENKFL